MNLQLEGKVVVITGGGTGIGRGLAIEFLKEGAHVCILGRRMDPLKTLHDEMERDGYDLFYQTCDVTDRQAVQSYVDEVVARFGHLDVWINNAGVGNNKKFIDYTDEDFDQIFSVNLKAVFQCT